MGVDTALEERPAAPVAVPADQRASRTAEARVRRRWVRPDPGTLFLYGSFATAVTLTFGFSPDDPFITLRYAWNFVHGNGPVFNAGQYVNGATSPAGLLLAVLAVVSPLGHAYFKLKILSLLFGLLTLGRIRKVVELLIQRPGVRYCALAATGLSASIAIASASGLETTVDSFAIAGLLLELCTRRAFTRPARACGLAVLAVLARPEAILVVVALAAVGILGGRSCRLRARLAWVVGPTSCEGVILLVNRLYYGSWFPNTFYAKELPPARASDAGWHYLIGGIHPTAVLGWSGTGGVAAFRIDGYLLGAMYALLLIGAVVALSRWRTHGYLLAAFAAQGFFVWRSGGDWMNGARFLEPVALVPYILQAAGIETVASFVSRSIRPRLLYGVATAMVLATSLYQYAPATARDGLSAVTRGVGDVSLVRAGGYGSYSVGWSELPSLLRCVKPGSVVGLTEVGLGAFTRPDLRILDLRGLTSSEIARNAPSSMKYTWGVQDVFWWKPTSPVGRVILSEEPAVVATVDPGPSSALDGRYHLVGTFAGRFSLYERSGVGCRVPVGMAR